MSATETETWVPIKGFPNYAISDKGRVMNLKLNREVKGHRRNDGNIYISLDDGLGHRRIAALHVLVAETFSLGFTNSNLRKRVTHVDGDRNNNSLRNLNYKANSRILQRDIPVHDGLKRRYIEVVETGMKFKTAIEVSEHLQCAVSSVYRCLNGHRPHISGVHLKYTWDS